jgi:hypothetical protein
MRVTAAAAGLLLGYYTVGLNTAPADTTAPQDREFNVRVLGGAGEYADITRGCSGNVLHKEKIPFREVGASVDFKEKHGRVGIRIHYFRLRDSELLVGSEPGHRGRDGLAVNPFAVLEGKYVAVGGGYFHAFNGLPDFEDDKSLPSFYLRLGPEKLYLDLAFLHAMPLLTGGYGRLGVGSRAKPGLDWWVGIGAGPYDGWGFHADADIRVRPDLHLSLVGRFGVSEHVNEGALALGFRYTFRATVRP